jgi:hypothetical protein
VWNLITLRAVTWGVSYLDDSSVHEQMVRFATSQIAAGHLPLTSWFPFLGLGSPQFLHYQSLPAMLTGLAGQVIGAGPAFRWSMYLLLSLWPVSIYAGARAFGIGRWAAAASALLSPFLVSATHIGYEAGAYVWIGYGVWTQLWASFTLPLAWGLSWRTLRHGRGYFAAALAVSLTIAFHFETGYLAILPLLIWPFLVVGRIRARVARAAVVLGGALLASAWVIVPLLAQRDWAATNEVLNRTPLVNGYGAPKVLGWLVTGRVLDDGRLPVITILAGIGLVLAIRRWRAEENGRGLIAVLVLCLVLSFGPRTLGGLADLIPGHSDLFFRRFMMGVQLAALLLAGSGAVWLAVQAWKLAGAAQRRWSRSRWRTSRQPVRVLVVALLAIALLTPAWTQSLGYERRNARAVTEQSASDRSAGAGVDRLVRVAKRLGGGRIYAGMPSNSGSDLRVGAVPVFKYLEWRDVDEVGYTLRTASLMTDPEYYFNDRNLSDYLLFGIRYVIVPLGSSGPATSVPITCAGFYCLRELPGGGYVHVGRIVGNVGVNRSNVSTQTLPILGSTLAGRGDYIQALWGHPPRLLPPLRPSAKPAVGTVTSQSRQINDGRMVATVAMREPGVVVFSASFDPGWQATVNGRPAPVLSVAPALVGVRVPAGRQTVVFQYHGYSGYPALFVLSGTALLSLAALDLARRRRRIGVREPVGAESTIPA